MAERATNSGSRMGGLRLIGEGDGVGVLGHRLDCTLAVGHIWIPCINIVRRARGGGGGRGGGHGGVDSVPNWASREGEGS
jgi:hypothetical protein